MPPRAEAPQTVGRYEVVHELGRGGMGVVYLARDPLLDRLLAVKVLAPALLASGADEERFLREARAAASLEHPHILPIYEAGDDAGVRYIAMRYVDSGDLAARILRDGALDLARALVVVEQIGSALDAAHARGLLHRDVKPGNVLVATQGESDHSFLADFGLARDARRADSGSGLVGTLEYLAPEQIRDDPVDGRADVYALGCLLFACLSGRPPFAGSDAQVLWAHLEAPVPSLVAARPELPKGVDDVVSRALAKRPAERYGVCAELVADLAAAARRRQRTPQRKAQAQRRGTRGGSAPHAEPPPQLIGRRRELAELGSILDDRRARLVTLTGSGGVGKTSLALELARLRRRRYRDGVHLADLSALADVGLLLPTIAAAVGLVESPSGVANQLERYLCERRALVILDNFEHLLDGAVELGALLGPGGRCDVIATSRLPLRISGECEYAVPPLALPDPASYGDPEALAASDAVALFCRRAAPAGETLALTRENAQSVAEICRRLDGLPLALELAAARLKLVSPELLLARLGGDISLLAQRQRDVPQRQRSLQATLDWSFDLLSAGEQELLVELTVFAGEFSLSAAEAVCSTGAATLDGLETVTDAGLLRLVRREPEPRFRLLETVRVYAEARCPGGAPARRRHLDYHLTLASACAAKLRAAGQLEALATLEAARDDLRAALRYALAEELYVEATALVSSLGNFWDITATWTEGRRAIRSILDGWPDAPARQRGELASWLSLGALRQGDLDEGRDHADRAIELLRGVGDPSLLAHAMEQRATAAFEVGRLEEAAALQREAIALAEEAGDDGLRSSLLNDLWNALPEGPEAERVYAEGLASCHGRGDGWGATLMVLNRASGEVDGGRHALATAMLDECLRQNEAVLAASPTLAMQLFLNRGLAKLGEGHCSDAAADLVEALRHAYRAGRHSWALDAADALVPALAGQRPEDAAWLDGLVARLSAGGRWPPPEPLVERLREGATATLSERLDPDRLAALRREGASGSFADALERLTST